MLNDLKEFEKFLKICRKQGVSDVTFAGVSVKLGDIPVKNVQEDESDDGPTQEELAFYHIPSIGAQ